MSSSEKPDASAPRRKLSCRPFFDALWFCYSPVHQMQQYYRLGTLDNCSTKFNALFDCLNLKTKRASEVEEILERREKEKPHIWSFRTPEEAASKWHELYEHLDEVEKTTAMVVLTQKMRLFLDGLKVKLKKTTGRTKSSGMKPKAPIKAFISPKNGSIAAIVVAITTDIDLATNLGITFLNEN